MRKSIIIGVPTLGTVSMRWALAHGQLAGPMNASIGRVVEVGYEVGVARNRIVLAALACEAEPSHLLFLDDDVIPGPYALLQLIRHDLDIVGGVYFTKGEVSEPLIFGEPGEGVMPYVPDGGVHRVWGIGMGLTLIKVDVFRAMRERLDLGVDPLGNPRWFYTEGDVPGEGRTTEDLWFCRQAHAAGFDVHVDMGSHAFGWHYCPKRQAGFPAAQWEEYLATGSATWPVPDRTEAA